jgi:hypothetical protein
VNGAVRPVAAGEDLYAILGVSPDASADDVRHAYRRKARNCHPDVTGEPAAAARFRRLRDAYDVLGDPIRRRAYDRSRAAHPASLAGPSPVHRAPGPTGAAWAASERWNVRAPDEEGRAHPTTRIDEWRVMAWIGRLAAAAVLLAIVVVTALALSSSTSAPATPVGSTAFCRTPDGWMDCRRVIDPLAP